MHKPACSQQACCSNETAGFQGYRQQSVWGCGCRQAHPPEHTGDGRAGSLKLPCQGQIPTQSQLSREGNTSAPSAIFLAQGLQSRWLRAQKTPPVHLPLSLSALSQPLSLTFGSPWAIREWFSDSRKRTHGSLDCS